MIETRGRDVHRRRRFQRCVIAEELKIETEVVARAAFERAVRHHQHQIVAAALRIFSERHLLAVTVGGRVRVKTDASYGTIAVGDRIVESSTPGAAMRSWRPGTVLGIAQEELVAGEGSIELLLQPGWHGGDAMESERISTGSETGRLGDLEDRLAALAAERDSLAARLATLEQIVFASGRSQEPVLVSTRR